MNWRKLRTPAFLVALCLLMVASVGMGAAVTHFKLTLRKLPIQARDGRPLSTMPRETESWKAVSPDRYEKGEVLETLGTTNYLTRAYAKKVTPKGPGSLDFDPSTVIDFHAAYYTGMIDTVPHVPDRCFVAGGMQLAELTKDVPLPLKRNWRLDRDLDGPLAGRFYTVRAGDSSYVHMPMEPENLRLHSMRFVNGGQDLYAGYFFLANGGAVPRAEDVRLLAFDLHSTYAYYVKVQFTSDRVKSEDELAALAASFLDENFGNLMECVPDWAEVEAGNYPPDNPARAGKSVGNNK
jgi:hypothetical protein